MFKQTVWAAFIALGLAACSSNQGNKPFATMSDAQMNRYIIDSNKVEQCLYPQITALNNQRVEQFYQSLPINEIAFLHYASDEILHGVIGEETYQRLFKNSQAKEYFEAQFIRLNHSKPIAVSAAECAKAKEDQLQFLQQYRSQI